MSFPALQHTGPLAINMNQPGSFVHWSIFYGVGGEPGPDRGDGGDLRCRAAAPVPAGSPCGARRTYSPSVIPEG